MTTDDKLARGLTRQIERLLARSSNDVRQQTFQFAIALLRRKIERQKVDGPAFNVPLAALMKIAATNPATLSVVAKRLTLGGEGMFHRTSLQTETIGHFRGADSSFQRNEWTVAVDAVQASRGGLSAQISAAPVLFDPHFVTRYLQRTETATAARAIDLVETTLPLAVLVRDSAVLGGGSHLMPLDVALPAPGGVLCGGTELVDCAALAYRFQMGLGQAGWGVDVIAMPITLQMAVSIRTYLPDEVLSLGQSGAVERVRRWYGAHRGRILSDPRAAFGWSDDKPSADRLSLIAELRAIYGEVQENFMSWRQNLDRTGYFGIDFTAIGEKYLVPEWTQRRADSGLIDRYFKPPGPLSRR